MIRRLAWFSIALLVYADAAWCEEPTATAGEIDQWIPSFGVSIGVLRQGAKGFQQNSLRPPDDTIPPPGPFPGTPSSGDDVLLDPFAIFTAEVMTPGIDAIVPVAVPGNPRLFVHGDIGGVVASEIKVAQEGSPGKFTPPPAPPPQICPGLPNGCPIALAVGGQGTETSVRRDALVGGVGMGIAFTVDLFDRRFRVKPSFEYLRSGVTAYGQLKHVTGLLPNYVFLDFQVQEERTLHYVGGGLELEMDTVRLGPFMLALFANSQVYRLIDDRNIDQASSFDFGGPQTAEWNVRLDNTNYRGAVGMRFRYFPGED